MNASKGSSGAVATPDLDSRSAGAVMDKSAEFDDDFIVRVEIVGNAPILFHKWDCDDVQEKADAVKGGERKKTDNLEAYCYRRKDKLLGVPGINFKRCIAAAAKKFKDPSSPRKSAMELFEAGILVLPVADTEDGHSDIAAFEPKTKEWQFVDRRRAVIQGNGITRCRPGLSAGWKLAFDITVLAPEYIDEAFLQQVVQRAGKLTGLCDGRPEFGRFRLTKFERVELK